MIWSSFEHLKEVESQYIHNLHMLHRVHKSYIYIYMYIYVFGILLYALSIVKEELSIFTRSHMCLFYNYMYI